MSQCNECRTEREITTAAAIAELRTEVRGLREDIKETLITQQKDHGKRIARLEQRGWWMAGWMAGAAAVGVAVSKFWDKLG